MYQQKALTRLQWWENWTSEWDASLLGPLPAAGVAQQLVEQLLNCCLDPCVKENPLCYLLSVLTCNLCWSSLGAASCWGLCTVGWRNPYSYPKVTRLYLLTGALEQCYLTVLTEVWTATVSTRCQHLCVFVMSAPDCAFTCLLVSHRSILLKMLLNCHQSSQTTVSLSKGAFCFGPVCLNLSISQLLENLDPSRKGVGGLCASLRRWCKFLQNG